MPEKRDRAPIAIAGIAALLLSFVGAGVAADRNEGTPGGPATAAVAGEVDTIARRIERIRGVAFERIPKPRVVTPEQTREYSLADLDRSYPEERRRADEDLLSLLGLIPPGTDLRTIAGDVSGGQVAGFYDPRRDRLAVVSGGEGSSNRTVAEITLAHELTHALEDQRFGIDEPDSGADDRSTAYTALVEGTATSAMSDYIERHVPPSAALSTAFSALGPSAEAAEAIPSYIQRSLEFSYTGGERFVSELRDVANGWKLVDAALDERPPASSEQILHPEKYMRFERPVQVKIGRLGLHGGWRRVSRGTIGELDTRELLRLGAGDVSANEAAAGWGGGTYELWTHDRAAQHCERPCAKALVLVLRWAWDTPADAREFEVTLPLYVTEGLDASAAGTARWVTGTGGVAIAVKGKTAALALAPSPVMAASVAASAGR